MEGQQCTFVRTPIVKHDICVYIHISITRMYLGTNAHIRMYTRICTNMYIYLYMCIHTYLTEEMEGRLRAYLLTSPVTNEPLSDLKLVPNRILEALIAKY